MSRIKAFRFKWTDAWGNIDHGYDSILETSEDDSVCIRFLVNNVPFLVDLKDREEEFINDLDFIKKWNNNSYDFWIEDSTKWRLFFTYDNTAIVSAGNNGYPSDFPLFLHILHVKYKIPKAALESDKKYILRNIKNTKVETDDSLRNFAIYFY